MDQHIAPSFYPTAEDVCAEMAFRPDRAVGEVKTTSTDEFHNEFRAVYTTPASSISSDEDRKRGYIVHRTDWFKSPIEARNRAMIRCEENHARITDIEMSWVTRSKPVSVGV